MACLETQIQKNVNSFVLLSIKISDKRFKNRCNFKDEETGLEKMQEQLDTKYRKLISQLHKYGCVIINEFPFYDESGTIDLQDLESELISYRHKQRSL